MSKLSNDLTARARNTRALVMQALASKNNGEIADRLGVDASTLSRMKNDKKSNGLSEIENACALLDALGLKVIPENYECYDRQFVESIFFLARLSMARASDINDYQHTDLSKRLSELGY
ncbi:hypothetical protein EA691_06415 [Acinetobacter baumannii]|uniref:Uncharacterized protein n=1 Tax=Acinetobacter baumannii TaxID=470 RepID=A0A8I0FCK6_ACIBA|nr:MULTISPECIES: hypothetical protein [Acinetobacter]EKT8029851.1 hypothetical protein [Acinetobacter baumannii]EKU1363033.1 hypothetical protein [Acinetobacter baumannii]EKU2340949.1 hypothetical protein [Acinetobacter baumannii]EKU9014339.1 hypothetical protein [Acinetobacter baumannii]EKU9028940.1 hypothetical protein [Acinetobacter baumannii]